MTRRYGSTALRLAQDYCSRALQHAEDGTPQRRDHFAIGTAAHMVLQALQDARGGRDPELDTDEAARIADAAAAALARGGWTHRGESQPPLRPDDVAEGRELAIQWHGRHGTIPGAVAEIGLTRDDGYGSQLDLTWIEYDESDDGAEPRATVATRDYKTSWRARAEDCLSIQMRAAALLAIQWARAQGVEPASVRIEIAAVRTGMIYAHEIWLDDPIIAEWDATIRAMCAGLDSQPRPRPADPSIRCGRCPYLHACQDGQAWLDTMGASDPHTIAARMVARSDAATADEMLLRDLLRDRSIDIDGKRIGYQATQRKVPAPGYARTIVETWAMGREWSDDMAAGLVAAMKPGVTAISSFAKAAYPERTKAAKALRDDLLPRLIGTETADKWAVQRVDAADDEEAGE
jgi:hypothetical protein